MWAQIQILQARTDVHDLNQTLFKLIEELNNVFGDVYGKVGFLAYVTGLESNSSTVSIGIKSGNYTIVDYLDKIFANLNHIDLEISGVQEELTDTYAETYGGLENLEQYANELEEYLNGLEEFTDERLLMLNSSVLDGANRQTITEGRLNDVERQLGVFTALSVSLTIALAILVIAIALVYSKVKAQKL